MKQFRKDFPLLRNNKKLVYLDNGATVQKPKSVIEGISKYLANDYSNIHRGAYDIAEKSEEIYNASKKKVADMLGGLPEEIIYTYNATYAFNMIAQTLAHSNKLKKGDSVLVGISEHHANIVPWLSLKDSHGINVKYIYLNENYDLDMQSFKDQYTQDVKVVSVGHVSNSTGTINDIQAIKSQLRDDTLFIVDGSQSVQHFSLDMKEMGCDFFVFTAHKIMAQTGLGVLRGKKELLEELTPAWGGGDTIEDVEEQSFTWAPLPSKYEPGTPNLIGAASLLYAIEYIEKIGGFSTIQSHENSLITYTLEKFRKIQNKYPDAIKLIGKHDSEGRVGAFSFVLTSGIGPKAIGEIMADHNICVRAGGHCTHPLMKHLELPYGTCRMSLYFYNTEDDIDAFFTVLRTIVRMGMEGTDDEDDGLC